MTTSGLSTFNPSLGDITLNAFGRIGMRPTQLVQDHLVTARMEANLLQVQWANKGPNLWTVDLQSVVLNTGVPTITLPGNTIALLDVYLTANGLDNQMMPISRSDYASYANKLQSGQPTVYWFNRQVTPTLTLWPVPDVGTYTLNYYRFRNIQDAALRLGETVELPYRWQDAMVAGLAHRLSRHFAPALEMARKADADDAYETAASEDTEDVPLYITPGLATYYRS